MSNLTETQQSTLEAAAKRANGSINPLPGNVKGGAPYALTCFPRYSHLSLTFSR